MLASDHRWQWEEWCGKNGEPRGRISEVKGLVLDAFLQARERSDDVREYGALLLDNQYAAGVMADAMARGIPVGAPVERPACFRWSGSANHFTRSRAATAS